MQRHSPSILVSCELPWDERERLIEETFREEIAYLDRSGFRQLYIFGTAGEGYAVDLSRFRDATELFLEETGSRGIDAQVGVIGLSTLAVLERIQVAWDLGCRFFQISLPSWGALANDEMVEFFRIVCGSFPEARFLHYNVGRAGRIIIADDYKRIVAENPNLVATKNTGANTAAVYELIGGVPELQHHLSEAMFPTGCAVGECSLLSSFGPLLPHPTQVLFDLGRNKRWDCLMPHWKQYMDVIYAFLRALQGESRIDGAYDKMIVRLAGVSMPLRLLSPYFGYTLQDLDRCRDAMRRTAPHWFENTEMHSQ